MLSPRPEAILLATHNPGKVRELMNLLSARGIDTPVWTLDDADISQEAPENGETFEANSSEKALFYSRTCPDLLVLAEDSGLEVDALDGAPGIRSARFGAPPWTAERQIAELLRVMAGRQNRKARFVAVATAARNGTVLAQGRGTVEGLINEVPDGVDGFGYDPVFVYPPAGHTFARMTPDEKNRVSHRREALERALTQLLTLSDSGLRV